jgi:L-ascorbate metabolism protein UlaG (beta-lactamase superfamily)
MELQYYGANCIRITTKKAAITIDDNLAQLGLKAATKAGDVVLFTQPHATPSVETKIVIDQPGEYEVSNTSVQGIAAHRHLEENESGLGVTMFKIIAEDMRVAVLGHIHPDLAEDQLEALGTTDILFIPVGGNGYTLDAIGAARVIKKIDPKLVIPTHYEDAAIKYEVAQAPLEEALKVIAIEPRETTEKLKIKSGELSEITQLVVLQRA